MKPVFCPHPMKIHQAYPSPCKSHCEWFSALLALYTSVLKRSVIRGHVVQIRVQKIDRFLFLSELDGVEVSFSFQPSFDVLYEVDQRLHQCSCPKAQMLGELPEPHSSISQHITYNSKITTTFIKSIN